jgi:hypothetical protein
MKVFIVLAATLSLATKQCTPRPKALPLCVRQKIEAIQREPKWNPAAEVNEYEYGGKRVYLFSSPCCDQYNTAVDGDCNYICAPSGGLTGKGDRKCEDFAANAKWIKLVWKDERGN